MAIDPDRATKTFRKLRKSMRNLSKHPLPEQIHSLRARVRHVETVIHALIPSKNSEKKRLLKALKPIRKRAGEVRDMDVLIAFAATLTEKGDDPCLVQLIEHLSFERVQSARRLHGIFAEKRKEIRNHLKRCSSLIEKQSPLQKKDNGISSELSAEATTTAFSLWAELSEWPVLDAANLHSFRLKVKELSYILQLAKEEDKKIVGTLDAVKDAIGEWHDWSELTTIAANLLKHGARCPLMKRVRSVTNEKLENALTISNAMRTRYQSDMLDPDRFSKKSTQSSLKTDGWQQVSLPEHLLPTS